MSLWNSSGKTHERLTIFTGCKRDVEFHDVHQNLEMKWKTT
jgi:hypothetical protein